jgi:hypothetical protein
LLDDAPLDKAPTVGIVYGFAEGNLTGRKLRQALRQAGYRIANPSQADIIIAHSGGYLVLPKKIRASSIIFVGANTWDRPLLTSLGQKLHYDYLDRKAKGQMLTWFLHGLRNDWYIFKVPHTCRLAWGYLRKPSQPPKLARSIVIRNRHDSYCTEEQLLVWAGMGTYISFDGGHDDIWNNPGAYVDVIQSLYRD